MVHLEQDYIPEDMDKAILLKTEDDIKKRYQDNLLEISRLHQENAHLYLTLKGIKSMGLDKK